MPAANKVQMVGGHSRPRRRRIGLLHYPEGADAAQRGWAASGGAKLLPGPGTPLRSRGYLRLCIVRSGTILPAGPEDRGT